MVQLLKYEVMKKWKLFLIVLSILALGEGFILYELLAKTNFAAAIGAFTLLGSGGLIFILIDSIYSYSRELNNKTGYMLFLTPRNSYQILGAKIIMSFVEVTVGFIIYILLGILNYEITGQLLQDVGNPFIDFLFELIQLDSRLFFTLLLPVLGWFSYIVTAIFSVTLSTTLLSNKRFKGVISFILFLVFSYVGTKLIVSFGNYIDMNYQFSPNTELMLLSCLFLLFSTLVYVLSSKLLAKYINL